MLRLFERIGLVKITFWFFDEMCSLWIHLLMATSNLKYEPNENTQKSLYAVVLNT